ncbi:MAG: hypothetical protein J6J20_02215 [Muribaculaceae bacterium]|nr:hypothetical protein [Muribaculaceae bacterium]
MMRPQRLRVPSAGAVARQVRPHEQVTARALRALDPGETRRFRVLTRSEAERECAFIRSFGAFARMAFTTAVSEAPAGFGFLIDVTRTE